MKRIDLLLTRLKTYVELLQVQLKLHDPGSNDHHLIQDELDTVEIQLEFMLSVDDHLNKRVKQKNHLTLIK